MKRFVNGVEVDLSAVAGAEITSLPDRLMVRSSEGSYSAAAVCVGDAIHVSYRGLVYVIEKSAGARRLVSSAGSGEIRASMPGQIVDVFVEEGDAVEQGKKLVVLEAMKTQQSFMAPFAGVAKTVTVAKGQQVADGDLLVLIESAASKPAP